MIIPKIDSCEVELCNAIEEALRTRSLDVAEKALRDCSETFSRHAYYTAALEEARKKQKRKTE